MVVLILFEPYFFHFALEIGIYVIIYVYILYIHIIHYICIIYVIYAKYIPCSELRGFHWCFTLSFFSNKDDNQ